MGYSECKIHCSIWNLSISQLGCCPILLSYICSRKQSSYKVVIHEQDKHFSWQWDSLFKDIVSFKSICSQFPLMKFFGQTKKSILSDFVWAHRKQSTVIMTKMITRVKNHERYNCAQQLNCCSNVSFILEL